MNHPLNLTTGQKVDICCAAGAAATGQKCRVAVGTVERLTKTRAIVRNDSTQNLSAYRLSDGGRVGGGDYSVTPRPIEWTAKDDGEGVFEVVAGELTIAHVYDARDVGPIIAACELLDYAEASKGFLEWARDNGADRAALAGILSMQSAAVAKAKGAE